MIHVINNLQFHHELKLDSACLYFFVVHLMRGVAKFNNQNVKNYVYKI
ncbi:hypothetical protein CHRY9393_00877 [Chryseobacterium fistulae]|uniref:Uncharacterized protein n=1 Tax=Chryseobacterium fistulae TaxID=2675058 RepID=A0A6N4XPI5_9FLAO|nr:hypothetical protein CHRY9393_00877 [Chryseobacterium fistulae]